MRARTGAAAGLAVLALAGCGTAAGPTDGGSTPASRDCGRVELDQGSAMTIPDGPLHCLAAGAEAGDPVTLVVVTPTTEGDPITTTYTVVDTGRVRVVVDSTQDAFAGGGAGITQRTCDLGTAGAQISVSNCTDPEPL